MPSELVADPIDVIVYLNRGGLRDNGSEDWERWKFEYSYPVMQSRNIGDVIFRFDPGNPLSMIRENRNRRKAVICIQSAGFELSSQWFREELESVLREKLPGGLFEPREADGRALFEATKQFLHFVGDQISKMVLSAAEPVRRFGPRKNGRPEELSLDLSGDESIPPADYRNLLRLWWLTLECLHRGIEGALHHQKLPDDQEAKTMRASVLKLRAHLAASLLESQTINDSSLLAALHESMLEWIDFNTESRTRDGDLDFLHSRYKELGDLLFQVKPENPLFQRLSWLPGFRDRGAPREKKDWSNSRRIAVRQAVISALQLPHEPKALDIIDRYPDALDRAREVFSKRYDVRELVAISFAWPKIRKSPARRQLRERTTAFVQGTWRHLPWLYPGFLLLALLGWVLFAWTASGHGILGPLADNILAGIFSVQLSIIYAAVVYFILFARIAEKLFFQTMPRILGSLIVGYVPLWLPQETWTFPFYMSWVAVLLCTCVLLTISYVYFVLQVSGRVAVRGEAIQKTTAVFLIAAAQAYCIGLLIIDFSARFFTQALPPSLGGEGTATLLLHLNTTGQIIFVDSPIALLGRAIGNQALAGHHFWILPKLQIFWFGLAMFIAVFLHILWEKEGILERL